MLANVKMYRAQPTKRMRGKSLKETKFDQTAERDSILDGLEEGMVKAGMNVGNLNIELETDEMKMVGLFG